MKMPYSVTNEIRDTLGWSEQLYQALWDILIVADGLGFLLAGLRIEHIMKESQKEHWKRNSKRYPNRKRSRETVVASEKAYPVFNHIIRRTLPFYKPFEFVAVKQIMQGLPQLAISGCNLSESTIRRVMIWLSPPHSDVFIKLNYRSNVIQTPIYGLNIPVLLNGLNEIWSNAIDDHIGGKDYLSDKDLMSDTSCRIADIGNLMLKPCIKYCDHFSEAFDFMSSYTKNIDDIYDFKSKLKRRFPNNSYLHDEFMKEREKIRKKIKRLHEDRLKGK